MRIFWAACLSLVATVAWSEEDFPRQFDRLMDAMRMNEVIGILVEEGRAAGLELEDSMFPGRGGQAWQDELDRIYEREGRQVQLRREMSRFLEGADMPVLLEFMESPRGQRIMALEVSARRAFMDPEMEVIAGDLYANAAEELPTLHKQVSEFSEVNNLVDGNVEGAFASNAAFALGAHEAGAFAGLTVDQLIAQMWQGDEAVRADVSDWLYAYTMTAYQPLSEDDMTAYIAISKTEPGQQLNAAIMTAFGTLFSDISYDLGAAAGRFMAQQDL
ncbi:MAG: hypothetical protein AAGI10_00770 [Pseudomonadota bacterium]